jgi:hypothetical protein
MFAKGQFRSRPALLDVGAELQLLAQAHAPAHGVGLVPLRPPELLRRGHDTLSRCPGQEHHSVLIADENASAARASSRSGPDGQRP